MQKDQFNDFSAPIKNTFGEFKTYLEQQLNYNKLVFTKKIGELSSYLTLMMILAFLATLILIFLSFAFVWWFSANNPDKVFIGYLIVAGFYALLGIVVFVLRESLIFKPIRKVLGNIIFSDTSSKVRNETFESAEMLDARITFSKERLELKEKELSKKINELGEVYNAKNIAKQMWESTYSKILTTTNMAKMAFNFVQSLKRKRRRKKDEISENNSKRNKNKN